MTARVGPAQMGGTWARIGMPSPTTSTASYNVDSELTNWDGNTLAYDANGNMTSDSVNTYSWNPRNELSSTSGLYSASFVYGPFGRRLQKTINGTTTDYMYDGGGWASLGTVGLAEGSDLLHNTFIHTSR